MTLRIDIRDRRLRGKRLTLSAGTDKAAERDRREATLRALIEDGEYALVEGVRNRELTLEELVRAATTKGTVARETALKALRLRVTGEAGPTLQAAVDTALATADIQPRTRTLYESMAKAMLAHFGGDRRLATVLTEDVRAYLAAPKATMPNGTPWGQGRKYGARMLGSLVWQRAIEDEAERAELEGRPPVITRNPWRAAKISYRANRVEFLQPAEWVAVRDGVRGRPACTLLALGCRAGLRAEEATYLRTGVDVDLERRVIHIRERRGAWPWRPKSKHSERDVPIPDDLHAILTEHMELGYAGRTFLLHSPGYDRPVSHTLVIKWTRAAFKAAGIAYGRKKDALTFHSLRHSYASHLTQAGMHPKKVARLIGDTAQQVLATYGHLAEDDHGEALQVLNELVTP